MFHQKATPEMLKNRMTSRSAINDVIQPLFFVKNFVGEREINVLDGPFPLLTGSVLKFDLSPMCVITIDESYKFTYHLW